MTFQTWHHKQQKQQRQKQEPNTALRIAPIKDDSHRNLTENPKALGRVRHPEAHPTPPNRCTQSGTHKKATLSYLLGFQFLDSPVVLLLLLFLLDQHRVSHER